MYKRDEHNTRTTERDYQKLTVSLLKSIKDVTGMEVLTSVILTKRSELRLHEKRRMSMLKTVEGRNEVQ